MIEQVDLGNIPSEKLCDYMLKHLEIVTVVSAIMLIRSGTVENLVKKRELIRYVKENNVELYHNLKYGVMGRMINLPGRIGRSISVGHIKLRIN